MKSLLKGKKLIVLICSLIIIALLIVITVVVIKKADDNSYKETNANQLTSQTETESTTEQITESTTQYNTVPIEWEKVEYTVVDNSGYKFEVSLSLSPWILLSNQDEINSAWAKVGDNNQLPGFDDWGLEKREINNVYNRSGMIMAMDGNSSTIFRTPMTDMYYCVGSLTITNITEGWDIDASNSRGVSLPLVWECAPRNSGINCIGRIFYSNGEKDYASGIHLKVNMQSNSWGPVPIVFMAPENISPNNPNGDYYSDMLNRVQLKGGITYVETKWNGEEVKPSIVYVGVIGKDGEYVKGAHEQ